MTALLLAAWRWNEPRPHLQSEMMSQRGKKCHLRALSNEHSLPSLVWSTYNNGKVSLNDLSSRCWKYNVLKLIIQNAFWCRKCHRLSPPTSTCVAEPHPSTFSADSNRNTSKKKKRANRLNNIKDRAVNGGENKKPGFSPSGVYFK